LTEGAEVAQQMSLVCTTAPDSASTTEEEGGFSSEFGTLGIATSSENIDSEDQDRVKIPISF